MFIKELGNIFLGYKIFHASMRPALKLNSFLFLYRLTHYVTATLAAALLERTDGTASLDQNNLQIITLICQLSAPIMPLKVSSLPNLPISSFDFPRPCSAMFFSASVHRAVAQSSRVQSFSK